MPGKMIYFTDDNNNRLREEKNMSKLINDLLNEHYNTTTPAEIRLQEEEDKINKNKEEIEALKVLIEAKKTIQQERDVVALDEWKKIKEQGDRRKILEKQYDDYLRANKLDFRQLTFQGYLDKLNIKL